MARLNNIDPGTWVVQAIKRMSQAILDWSWYQTIKASMSLAAVLQRAMTRKHVYLCRAFFDEHRKHMDAFETTLTVTRANARKID